jgi:hypothetical protein
VPAKWLRPGGSIVPKVDVDGNVQEQPSNTLDWSAIRPLKRLRSKVALDTVAAQHCTASR